MLSKFQPLSRGSLDNLPERKGQARAADENYSNVSISARCAIRIYPRRSPPTADFSGGNFSDPPDVKRLVKTLPGGEDNARVRFARAHLRFGATVSISVTRFRMGITRGCFNGGLEWKN